MLCPVFAFLYPTHKERLISLATSLGMDGYDDTIKVNNLLNELDQLKQKIDIPLSIKATGLGKSSFQAQLDPLINRCIDQISSRAAMYPGRIRPPSATEMRELFVHAWNGTRAELR
jgi:acetaldehyde dehydrogenase/alcohol dehydrogenase